MDWVTDQKAIDVIVKLKGLCPGDQVRITGAAKYGLPDDWDGRIRDVVPGDLEGLNERTRMLDYVTWRDEPPVACVHEDIWIICRKNIAAWRRPRVLKE